MTTMAMNEPGNSTTMPLIEKNAAMPVRATATT
jgi:hypothetical protein